MHDINDDGVLIIAGSVVLRVSLRFGFDIAKCSYGSVVGGGWVGILLSCFDSSDSSSLMCFFVFVLVF